MTQLAIGLLLAAGSIVACGPVDKATDNAKPAVNRT